MKLAEKVTNDLLCFHNNGMIDLNRIRPGTESQNEYYYAHLPLAAIDAVFSKGQSYSTTVKVVNSYCSHYNVQRNRPADHFPEITEQESISQFLKKFLYEGEQIFRTVIFGNSEPVSFRHGSKKKSMAVYDFAGLLHEHGVEYFQDIEKVLYDNRFAQSAVELAGMTDNGLNYFFMIAGSDYATRPVRLTIDFINGLTNDNVGHDYSAEIINEVCIRLKSEFSNITPRILGYLIWEYMRNTRYDMPN